MKKLTDKRKILKVTIQSLSALLIAIAVVLYIVSRLPLSVEEMKGSTALIERSSYYEVYADGHLAFRFKELEDSLMANMSPSKDPAPQETAYITGAWVNNYPLFPSCYGMLLPTRRNAAGRLTALKDNPSSFLRKNISVLENESRRLDRQAAELKYYMSVHNVSDEGYNIMAEYSDKTARQTEVNKKLLTILKAAVEKQDIKIKHVEKYTLIYKEEGKSARMTCSVAASKENLPFIILQTEDHSMPEDATALYLHTWTVTSTKPGKSILAASIPGCSEYGFSPVQAQPDVFGGTTAKGNAHDISPLLAPDGSPVFSSDGVPMGISYKGKTITPDRFGFGFNKIMK